jgi:enamine deaminase RidA (YjgF/YER057c/UK114 family)
MPLYPGVPYEYTSTAGGLVFTAGACPLDAEGRTVAPGDLAEQTRCAVDNLLEAVAEAGVTTDDLLKTTIYVVADKQSDLVRAWSIISERIGRVPSTLLGVSLLGYPDQLVEIEAIARIS